MIAVILGGLAAVLWILGGHVAAGALPEFEKLVGRELRFTEKAQIVLGWPLIALLDLIYEEGK